MLFLFMSELLNIMEGSELLKNLYSSEFSACKRTVKGAQGVEKLEKAFLVESLAVMKFQSQFIVNLAVKGFSECMTLYT